MRGEGGGKEGEGGEGRMGAEGNFRRGKERLDVVHYQNIGAGQDARCDGSDFEVDERGVDGRRGQRIGKRLVVSGQLIVVKVVRVIEQDRRSRTGGKHFEWWATRVFVSR